MTLTSLLKATFEIPIKTGVHNIHRGLHQELQQIHPLQMRRLGPTSLHIIVLQGCQEILVHLAVQGIVPL